MTQHPAIHPDSRPSLVPPPNPYTPPPHEVLGDELVLLVGALQAMLAEREVELERANRALDAKTAIIEVLGREKEALRVELVEIGHTLELGTSHMSWQVASAAIEAALRRIRTHTI